jgi:septum formation protein
MDRIWLASRSPRRSELLAQAGIAFDVVRVREAAAGRPADVVEGARDGEPPLHYLERIARTKAQAGWRSVEARGLERRPVLGADTEVIVDGEVLGKPADDDAARAMLARLAGRRHEVATAVAVKWHDDLHFALSLSTVELGRLSRGAIDAYVATGEPFGKAGGYAIQGRAGAFIVRIEGSYSGIVGLPLAETVRLLGEAGFPVP